MEIPHEPRVLQPGELGHVGQVVFAADGRARALVWGGRRYVVAGDTATQQAIGTVARQANLYIDPATLELFDDQRRPLGRVE
ncbi:MAG TPA: hypothetical protein VM536_18725 [Chloroflexia bacterium]|nr:hypothetical protein [Chloroflexia bacterium]